MLESKSFSLWKEEGISGIMRLSMVPNDLTSMNVIKAKLVCQLFIQFHLIIALLDTSLLLLLTFYKA